MIQKINKMLVAAASMVIITASATAQNSNTTINSDAPPAPPAAPSPKAAPRVRTLTSVRGMAVTDNDTYNKDIKDLKSKEVSVVIPASKSADIYIENTQRTIIVKTWAEAKVKVTTTVYYEGDATKVSDEEWFEKLNLSVKSLGNSIRVKSGTVSSSGSYTTGNGTFNWSSGSGSGVAIFNSDGENIGTKSNVKRFVTVYIPESNRVDVESKYSDISITNNVSKLTADITNGSLDIQDVANFTLRSKYANVTTGNLKNAEVEFINGRFTAKDIEDLDIDTKYSTIEIASVKKATIRSTNDEYEIEEAGVIQGRKNYGNFRISKLNNSIELDGTNADVKVRNIAPTVDLIKFDNKYADIRLPLRNLKNYTVTYVGPYSSVYANFEKQPLAATSNEEVIVNGKKTLALSEKEKADKEKAKADKEKSKADKAVEEEAMRKELFDIDKAVSKAFKIADQYGGQNNIENRFTAKVGDGKGTVINMKCQNCTVDFK